MKKIILLLACVIAALNANAVISVCDVPPDENGHFDCPYIKSGTITWDKASKTLTLNNAVVEYITNNVYDYVYPIRVTEDATIVVHGDCKLLTNGFSAIYTHSYEMKYITITGDGSLSTSSTWIDIFLYCARLTIKDIYLETINGIAENGNGVNVALTFDNVEAYIKGSVERIGEGITFVNCSITYPADAYISEYVGYGYAIYYGNGNIPDHIIISRTSNVPGDLNGDDEVNIADINAVIKVILGGESNPGADVNNDSEVNIADVNAIINIILNPVVIEEHEYVDLGLPSGTLWAKCNIGASSPEECGDYFAWGETVPREVYNWGNYKWFTLYDGGYFEVMKYCTDSEYGAVDGKTELDPEDDAAYVNWGSSWRMPTQEQIQELISKCSSRWTTQNGVKGRLLSGPNGNTLFLPAAGYRWGDSLKYPNSEGHYWSRTLCSDDPALAYTVQFADYFSYIYCEEDIRCYAYSVRAVRM